MKPLPETFDQKGFNFKIIKRSGCVALLEKTHEISKGRSYEVVIVRKLQEKRWPDGRITEAHEAMPASESWGTDGWSYPTIEKATSRYEGQVLHQNA